MNRALWHLRFGRWVWEACAERAGLFLRSFVGQNFRGLEGLGCKETRIFFEKIPCL
jgi:hypothetical protein